MKYLEELPLTGLNAHLGHYELGDRLLSCKLEAYSCKKAGSAKRLAKSLEHSYQQEISTSYSYGSLPEETCLPSSLGSISQPATRKLLIDLISTMNASFPDYDFSTVRPEQFVKEADYRRAVQGINHDLAELIDQEGPGFVEKMWGAIHQVMNLDECEVYSYLPDMDSDPFSDGTLWSFNYFFYNRSQRKILYFTCMAKGLSYDDDMDDEMMDERQSSDGDDSAGVADYFGMSPDWEDGA